MPGRARAPAFTLTRFGAAGRSERRESEGEALSLDHPAYEQLTTCSPCYVEFRSLQESMSARDSRSSSSG